MWEKRASWSVRGKLTFELSCGCRGRGQEKVHQVEGTASAKPGAQMRVWLEQRAGGQERRPERGQGWITG